MTTALAARGLAKDHAGERALDGVSLSVPAGSLYGLIGADGAGKSTLLDILATLADPDAGSAEVLGLDLREGMAAIRSDIGYMPQRFSLYQDLSVRENLDFFADVFGLAPAERRERMASLLGFAGLEPFQGRRAGRLSGGMKQKLALACTLIHEPRLLLLDEPTVGVDPVARRDFWRMLKALRDRGIAVVVSTPYMDEAALCDRLALLHRGRILAEGTPADLLAEYPHRLWRVEADATLHYPADRLPPSGFALLYPAAGALHAAEISATPAGPAAVQGAAAQGAGKEDVLARLRAAVPQALSARRIDPSVEDLLFALLSREAA